MQNCVFDFLNNLNRALGYVT